MSSERTIRLASYASTALATTCHADIRVYDGPSIPIGPGNVLLELDGLQIELRFSERSHTGSSRSSWWTCCDSSGGPSCNWSDFAVQSAFYGTRFLSAFAVEGVSTVDFLPLGEAPEGSEGNLDSTFGCRFTYVNLQACGDLTSTVFGDCDESSTMYLGFTAPRNGVTATGWIEIERAQDGFYSISRWAFEDEGSLILTGQVPEVPCTGDLDESGRVDSADLGSLLAAWGECGQKGGCRADIDENGRVDAADLGLMIAAWGACPDDPCAGADCFSDDPCTLAACIDGICYTDDLRAGSCNPGDCCIANGTPGCIDESCMEVVCQAIPECCDVAWDSGCALIATIFGCDCP